MKNLLFISTYPFPLDMGSKQHAYYFIKSLVDTFNVYCIFFVPPNTAVPLGPTSNILGLGVKDYSICTYKELVASHGIKKWVKQAFAFPNRYMNHATHHDGLNLIRTYITKYRINIIHFEHFWYTKYAFRLGSNQKKVIVYHDLHHAIYRQMAKLEKKFHRKMLHLIECMKLFIYEHLLEKYAALKVFLNPIEMKSFPKNAVKIPHIVNADIVFKPPKKTDCNNILFIGAFSHPPNRQSIKFIIDQLLPKLVELKPNVKLHIVGPGTENFAGMIDRSPYKDFVVIHGFKRCINDAFKKMDIALFPIFSGGGIKTKIIDALAAGVPVVTTPSGVLWIGQFTGQLYWRRRNQRGNPE